MLKYFRILRGFEIVDFFVYKKYNKLKLLLVNLICAFSLIAYLSVTYYCYEDNFYLLVFITTISTIVLIFLLWLKANDKLSTGQTNFIIIYLPIINLQFVILYFLFIDQEVSVFFYFQTLYKFWLLLLLSVALIAKEHHILIVGSIVVSWIWIFSLLSRNHFFCTWAISDSVMFVFLTVVLYVACSIFSSFFAQLDEFLRMRDSSQVVRLEKSDEYKKDVFNMLMHDLKIPINRVLYAARMEVIPHKEIEDSSRDMLILLQNILDVSKLNEMKMSLKLSTQRIDELVVKAKMHIDYLLNERKITIITNFFCKDTVMLDENLIERVLVNLLNNAVKYSKVNSSIEIRITSQYDFVRAEVIDTGEGISPDKIDHIFEKYYHGHTPESRLNHSTGLGLTFCKMVIEAHGGTIGAKSTLNEGFTIWFELPVENQNEMVCDENVEYLPPRYLNNGDEDEMILYCKQKIADLPIYQSSEIISICSSVVNHSPDFSYWKEELIHSALSGNVDYFDQLRKIEC